MSKNTAATVTHLSTAVVGDFTRYTVYTTVVLSNGKIMQHDGNEWKTIPLTYGDIENATTL